MVNLEQSVAPLSWYEKAMEAYAQDDSPNYLDKNGELIPGIYLNLPNTVYHSLDALSSSALKKFMESPAHYYRQYISRISRKRTTAQKNTFDAGTLAHELVLEPEGFYSRYFRKLLPVDMPNALTTAKAIEDELVKRGLPKSGNKEEKATRLIKADPSVEVFSIAEAKHNLQHGQPDQIFVNDEKITTYGGKTPMDGQVWDDAHRAFETTRKHREADSYLKNGMPEVTMIARCPVTDLMVKVRFDWLRFDNEAVDLKTAQSTRPDKFKRQTYDLHYDVQQEFYKYVALLTGIEVTAFTFVATEYIHADICQPFTLSNKHIAKAKRKTQLGLKRLKECMDSGNWYGWSESDCTMRLE